MSGMRDRLATLSPEQRTALRRRLARQRPTAPAEPAAGPGRAQEGPRWSLFFFSSDPDDAAAEKYDLLLDCARFADREGFEAVWIPERHFDAFGAPYPDPAVLASALVAATERIDVRAGSVVLPLHDPLLVAERWAMLDNLSRGRVGLSVASGWHAQDFVLAPGAYEGRRELLAERLHELWSLWAGNVVERVDGTGTQAAVRIFPRPWQAQLPTWMTSSSNVATWVAAGELGTNVLTALLEQSVEDVAEKAAAYRAARQAAGADPDGGAVTLMIHTFVGERLDDVRATVQPALTRYLSAHVALFEKLVRARGLDVKLETVTEADKETLVNVAFERYFATHGLFGTPESCLERVQAFAAAGVDEIACLVDFGVAPDVVLANLANLARLRREALAAFSPA